MSDTRRSIVVVDDDAEMGQALERLLTAAGFRPTVFSSAEAALDDEAVSKADFLILDIHLPGASGFELRKAMVGRGIAPPVIFITAYDDPVSRARAQAAGAIAFFTKPFRGQPLIEAIAGVIGK